MSLIYTPPAVDIQGWMSPLELQWLFETARKHKSIVEVGSWKGKSTHALASGTYGHVFCVDHFNGSPAEIEYQHREAKEGTIYGQFVKNMEQFKNISILRMESQEASKYFAVQSVDMVFIDGEHTCDTVTWDILCWRPICKILLAGHDVGATGVEEALHNLNVHYEIVPNTSIWYEVI